MAFCTNFLFHWILNLFLGPFNQILGLEPLNLVSRKNFQLESLVIIPPPLKGLKPLQALPSHQSIAYALYLKVHFKVMQKWELFTVLCVCFRPSLYSSTKYLDMLHCWPHFCSNSKTLHQVAVTNRYKVVSRSLGIDTAQ